MWINHFNSIPLAVKMCFNIFIITNRSFIRKLTTFYHYLKIYLVQMVFKHIVSEREERERENKIKWNKKLNGIKFGRCVQMCKLIWLIKVQNEHHGIQWEAQILYSMDRHSPARYGTNIFYVAVDGVAWPKTEIRITVTKLQLTHTPTFAMIVQILFKIARLHRHYNI